MHVEACIILSAEHLLNKMRTLAHLILAFAIWLAVHMETAIEAFGVPPNITMAVGGEVGEVIHMHVGRECRPPSCLPLPYIPHAQLW